MENRIVYSSRVAAQCICSALTLLEDKAENSDSAEGPTLSPPGPRSRSPPPSEQIRNKLSFEGAKTTHNSPPYTALSLGSGSLPSRDGVTWAICLQKDRSPVVLIPDRPGYRTRPQHTRCRRNPPRRSVVCSGRDSNPQPLFLRPSWRRPALGSCCLGWRSRNAR